MEVIEKEADGLSRVYEVVIAAKELSAKLDAKIDEIQPQVRLKGFRPGKVPASHIRKMFGRDIFKDVVDETVAVSSQDALKEREIRPAGSPEIEMASDVDAVAKGEADLAYEIRVELMPEFTPIEPKTLTLTRPVAEVGEEDIEKALSAMAEEQKSYEAREEKAASVDGDMLVIDFVGRVDGEEFAGGKGEDAELVLGSNAFIPGFEEQLVGSKAGDEVTVSVTFPEDYGAEDLKGKDAEFGVTVKEVRAPSTPEVGDDLAKAIGFEDLEKLTEAIKTNLERQFAGQSRQRVKRRLLDALDEAHDFELPQRMVDAEFDQIWRQVEADLAEGRLGEEDEGKSEDELKTEYRAIAERRVRLGLVLAEIGRGGSIDVAEEELARAVSMEARRHPGHEGEVVRYFQENAAARAQLRAPLFEEKVVDYVLELAEVTDETVDREALFAADD